MIIDNIGRGLSISGQIEAKNTHSHKIEHGRWDWASYYNPQAPAECRRQGIELCTECPYEYCKKHETGINQSKEKHNKLA